MQLIIGLGNPGDKYKNNRHNVGFMFVDYYAKTLSREAIFKPNKYLSSEVFHFVEKKIVFIKPQTYMNASGPAVSKSLKMFGSKPEDIVVVHDDLDIPFGKFHIQKGRGPQLHNGIESIEKSLGTKDFSRVRIGVDARKPDLKIAGEAYVLQDFLSEERDSALNKVFPQIILQLQSLWPVPRL